MPGQVPGIRFLKRPATWAPLTGRHHYEVASDSAPVTVPARMISFRKSATVRNHE
jgi:hypothetical protein